MDGGLELPTDFTSSIAPALASYVSRCMRKTPSVRTLRTSLIHPQKVSMVAGLGFGVTARKRLLGLSSDTGTGFFHSYLASITYVTVILCF